MGRENQGEEQGERRPSDSARTQTTTTHLATHPNTNKYSANTPNKSDHSTTTQKHRNLAESGGKTRGVKKVRKGNENCVEKLKKQPSFFWISKVDTQTEELCLQETMGRLNPNVTTLMVFSPLVPHLDFLSPLPHAHFLALFDHHTPVWV